MRPIKFRAYIKSISIDDINYDDEFAQSLVGNIYPILMLQRDRQAITISVGEDYNPVRLDWNDHIVLMQYTGLNDKNDKEIYEGDILAATHAPLCNMVVNFEHGSFCAQTPWVEIKSLWGFRFSIHNFEIIGNIYQHPELLKKDSWHYPAGNQTECTEAAISNLKTGEMRHHSLTNPEKDK